MEKLKMNLTKAIGVMGDSILRGVVFDTSVGKYKMINESAANMFSTDNKVLVNNHSKFGYTTDKALEKLPTILQQDKGSELMLLEYGGNDCDFDWHKVCENPELAHEPNVPFEKFKQNITFIIEKLIGANKKPVIVTLPPIDSELYFDWIIRQNPGKENQLMKFLGEKNYIYRHQEMYATALEKIAAAFRLPVINIREKLLQIPKYSDYLCLDGIHLNENGQVFIKNIFNQRYNEYLSTL